MTEKEMIEKKKGKRVLSTTNEHSGSLEEKELKKNKKGSKFIPKPKIVETSNIQLAELSISLPETDSVPEMVFGKIPHKETVTEPEIVLPNVVVRLRCQLSDLNRPVLEESQMSNPYEYKAWIPSEIKTYNTSEFQAGSLSMEPIHFMGMPAMGPGGIGGSGDGLFGGFREKGMGLGSGGNLGGNSGMEPKEREEFIGFGGDEKDENYAYLDAKWLHSGMVNKLNMKDTTPLLNQIIQTPVQMPAVRTVVTGSAENIPHLGRIGGGIDVSEYSKAPISKEIQQKLYQQKVLLYHGLVQHQKRSACFWCTCDYDTPACAIPYYNVDGTLDGYGSFCRPECAVAYLYSEKLDDSVRADRDHLINFYYGKTYGYEKRIKPAPDPHYLLDKYFGNLTIQEYRKLLKSEHLLATLERPMTRIFPELHEITDDILIQIYGGDITLNRGYRVKRASEQVKGPSKMEILRDQFKKPLVA